MARVCENCGKGAVVGHSKQHRRGVAGKRWKKRVNPTPRMFKPNLQLAQVMVGGKLKQMRLCTDCISKFRNQGKITSGRSQALGDRA